MKVYPLVNVYMTENHHVSWVNHGKSTISTVPWLQVRNVQADVSFVGRFYLKSAWTEAPRGAAVAAANGLSQTVIHLEIKMSIYIYIDMSGHRHMCVYTYVYYMYIHMHINVYIRISIYIYTYAYHYIYIYTCISIYRFV